MKLYIASSWKNQHAVEMLTALLRDAGHTVLSWVENNYGENHGPTGVDFEQWVRTEAAERAFLFDTQGAMKCDVCVYVSPGGTDAWAEVGAAYGAGRPIIGLWAKGEPSGLMRMMMNVWVERYTELLDALGELGEIYGIED